MLCCSVATVFTSAKPPLLPESRWPHKPMGGQQWSLPDVCDAAALLLPRLLLCSAPAPQLQPGAGTHGLKLCHVCRVITALNGNVEGAPGQLWVCFTVGNSRMGGKHRVLNDCGRKRERKQGSLSHCRYGLRAMFLKTVKTEIKTNLLVLPLFRLLLMCSPRHHRPCRSTQPLLKARTLQTPCL